MHSVCPDPNLLMCSMASCILATDFSARTRSQYSVDQSSLLAGCSLDSSISSAFFELFNAFRHNSSSLNSTFSFCLKKLFHVGSCFQQGKSFFRNSHAGSRSLHSIKQNPVRLFRFSSTFQQDCVSGLKAK